MELICTDQPPINYLIVTCGRPRTSLLELGAGVWAPTAREKKVRRMLPRLGLFRSAPGVRWFLAHRKLWMQYRAMTR